MYISIIMDKLRDLEFLHLVRLREIYVQEVETRNLKINTGLLSAWSSFEGQKLTCFT
jgi:hypothetical protein